jgi:hypothetical protein
MFELLVAAKLLLLAPQAQLGSDRAAIETRLGTPLGVGTDWMAERGRDRSDRVVTLDWPDIRVRLYESPATKSVVLLGVTVTKDVLSIDSPVHVGVDRGTVLRELGGPAFEDQDQIVYSLQQESTGGPNYTMRVVLQNDRVIGIDWTYPLAEPAPVDVKATAGNR